MKPMRAATCIQTNKIKYPVYVSPKYDGIRALVVSGQVLSKSLKRVPNYRINDILSNPILNGLDGEIVVGEPNSDLCYRKSLKCFSFRKSTEEFHYYVFDDFSDNSPFDKRTINLKNRIKKINKEHNLNLIYVEQTLVYSEKELLAYEKQYLDLGYEGIMIRNPDAFYKEGKCTIDKENTFKLKRFGDAEAIVIGFGPMYKNNNEKTINELGLTSRSSKKDGLIQIDSIGYLIVRGVKGSTYENVVFKLGNGYSKEERDYLWRIRDSLIGKMVKYKYLLTGGYSKPRKATYLGFRSHLDFIED